MANEPHTHPENRPPEREREVIVTDGGRRSSMSGVVVAVLAVIVIAIVGILVVNAIGGTDGDVDMEAPAVEVPDDVNVDVNEGGDGS